MSSKDKLEIYDLNKNNSNFKENILNKINNEHKNNKSTNKWFKKLKQGKSIKKKLDYKDVFNMEGPGTINLAKLHRDANRPLKKIKEFDENIQFCPCCSLPKQKEGYIEELNYKESTDDFTQCGTGIPLYFSFFRFSLIILIFASLSISLPTLLLSNYYTNQLMIECGKIHNNDEESVNIYQECNNFFVEDTKSFNGSSWSLRFNAINLNQYKLLYLNKTNNTIAINKVSIDYSLIYFLSLITLYIINLSYIILLFNINKRNDMLVTTPGDYTVMISNLFSTFDIFSKNINSINNTIIRNKKYKNEYNKSSINQEENLSKDKNIFLPNNVKLKIQEMEELGLEELQQDKEINFLEGFNTFIKNRICVSEDGDKFNVSQINICYKIKELKENEDKIQDKKLKILKIKFDPKQQIKNEKLNLKGDDRRYFYYLLNIYGINLCQLNKCKTADLSNLEKEQLKLQKKLNNLLEQSQKNLTKKNFSGVIFVTFNTKEDKEKFLKPYPKNCIMLLLTSICNLRFYLCGCFINSVKRKSFFIKKNMIIESAPEPEEIKFENLEISSKERFFRTLLIYLISIIIIAISFALISRLTLIQKKIKDKEVNYSILIKYGVSLIITVVISLINEILKILLEFLTKMEKHITVFTFISSSIVPLVSNHIYNKGDYDLLVENILILFLSNSFVTPIMWTLNFKYFFKKIVQFILERKKVHYFTQNELNNLYELPNMNISYKYSYLAKTLLMSFLFVPIFPLGIIISLLGLLLGYYLEKYNFIKMYKRPEILNSNLSEFYTNYFIANFFMLTIGNYIFLKDNNIGISVWTYLNIYIFGILIIIPYNQIFSFDFIGIKEYELKNTKNYEDEYFNFYNDYERSNPMTKKEGMKRFIFKLKEKGYINVIDEAILKNINNINLMEVYYKSKKNYNTFLIQRGFSFYNSKNGNIEYKNILKNFQKEYYKILFLKV